MKKLLLILAPILIMAKVHYAKVEPYDTVILKSAVSAKVLSVDLNSEGREVNNREVISLDDVIDKQDLKLSQEMLIGLKSTYKRKESYFNKLNRLSTASKAQKDGAYYNFIASKNQYLATKLKIERLKDSISKKHIILKNKYLYKLHTKAGEFVNFGSPLATIQDLSKAKLVLFLESQEVEELQDKSIYLDGNRTNLRVDKVWQTADTRFISSYRAEIVIDKPQIEFSKLVKVEIK
ncbi:hypothetical protein MNB_SV-15-118 [hydrothermal vent metagenome]|uniref:HlyD family secretion protein n=1 Tax=hydrothermal vent metagenome TaxID=652676 RepID=A0A1W1EIB1_9ZZZZ